MFTGARSWIARAGSEMETDVLVDCFVALYRLKYDNEVFRVCLAPYSLLQLVLVAGLYRISVQVTTNYLKFLLYFTLGLKSILAQTSLVA